MKPLVDPQTILNTMKKAITESSSPIWRIALFSGVGKSTVRSLFDGSHVSCSKNIRKIAKFFKIEIGDFEGHLIDRLKKSPIHYSYIAQRAIVSDQYVAGIMNGRYKPSLFMCILLSEALNTLHKEREIASKHKRPIVWI